MAASKPKTSSPQPVAIQPASSFSAWLVVAVAAIFGVLGLVDVSAEMLYDLKGSRATGQVLEFHAMSSRSHSIEATVMAAPAGVAPFKWQVQDTFGLHSWTVGETAPLLCAHMHADHVSCVLDSYVDRYVFSLVMLLFGGGIAVFGAARLLRRPSAAPGAGAAA